MNIGQRLAMAAACVMAYSQLMGTGTASAEPANPSLWGYSGLLNVPTADTLGGRRFATGLRYFPLNTGFSGTASFNIFDDLEAALVFGVPPANGFSALAASVKYRFMDQNKNQPLSLAIGATMLGLDNTAELPGNQLYLVMSRGFDWDNQRFLNIHGGFMGGLSGARLVAGLDVPIGDIVRIEAEYLGNVSFDRQIINFGAVVTPHPDVSIELGLNQQPTTNFADRDISLGVTYYGDWGQWLGATPASSPATASPQPTPTASKAPSQATQPPADARGNIKVRILDKERIIALEGAEVTLKQPSTGLSFAANTDVNGTINLPGIPVGKYQVKVNKTGWKSETRMVSIQPELNTFLEIPISGIAGSVYGTVSGLNNASDVRIEILDAAGKVIKRQILEGNTYGIENIPPGQYTLVVKQGTQERSRVPIQVKGDTRSQYDLNPVGVTTTPSSTPGTDNTANSGEAQPALENTEIRGSIKDKQGRPLSGVRLELKSDDLLVITLTKPDGSYAFRDIPKGVYRLGISSKGYKSRAFQITINKIEALTHNFSLEPSK